MDMVWFFRNVVATLLLPPFCLLIPLLLGIFFIGKKRYKAARWCIGVSCLALYLASTRLVAAWLMAPLENGMRFAGVSGAQAIVVLGGGRRQFSEYNHEPALAEASATRLRYGAWLARQQGLPLLVTGGAPEDAGVAEASIMQNDLHTFYGLSAKWVETKSNTTAENAVNSAVLLKAAGVHRVILVSHGWHLPRAMIEFQRAGLEVVPAGVDFTAYLSPWPRNLMPATMNIDKTYWAAHELLGLIWYRLKS